MARKESDNSAYLWSTVFVNTVPFRPVFSSCILSRLGKIIRRSKKKKRRKRRGARSIDWVKKNITWGPIGVSFRFSHLSFITRTKIFHVALVSSWPRMYTCHVGLLTKVYSTLYSIVNKDYEVRLPYSVYIHAKVWPKYRLGSVEQPIDISHPTLHARCGACHLLPAHRQYIIFFLDNDSQYIIWRIITWKICSIDQQFNKPCDF